MEKKHVEKLALLFSDGLSQYDFFQAVRILERGLRIYAGDDDIKLSDYIRFVQNYKIKLFVSDIEECRYNANNGLWDIKTNFFGLMGTNGIMPYFYSEFANDCLRNGSSALSDFLDIFHNRIISLFYEAWSADDQVVNYERGNQDAFLYYLENIIGLNSSMLNEMDFNTELMLFFACHSMEGNKSIEGIESILNYLFKLNIKIQEFVDMWLPVPHDSLFKLDSSSSVRLLGCDAFLGDSIWNCTAKFRVKMGTLSFDRYNLFLPNTLLFSIMKKVVDSYTPKELFYDFEFELRAGEAPFLLLKENFYLGYNTWLISERMKGSQKIIFGE